MYICDYNWGGLVLVFVLVFVGRHIFMGYMFNDEKTAETIDDDGFSSSILPTHTSFFF